MKIIKLHIENFGKLSNFDYVFDKNLTQIVEDNGWGKTTLSTFIKSIFYGLEANGRKKDFESQRSKYFPWQGGNYGGNLTFQTSGKTYTVFRTFGKTPEQDYFQLYDEDTKRISYDYSKEIGKELFGVGEETFVISSYFGQSKLNFDLTDQAISSLAGLEKFKNDAENVDIALNIIEKKRKEIVAYTPKVNQLNQVKKSIETSENLLVVKENRAKEIKEKLLKIEEDRNRVYQVSKAEDEQRKKQVELLNEKTLLQEKLNQKNTELSELLTNETNCEKSSKFNLKFLLSLIMIFASVVLCICGMLNLFNLVIAYVLAVLLFIGGFISFILGKKKSSSISNDNEKNVQNLRTEIEILKQKLQIIPNFDIKVFEKNNELIRNIDNDYIATQTSFNEALADIELIKEELSVLIENKKKIEDDIKLSENKINILKQTSKFLENARENVSQRFVNPLNNKFKKLFEKFNLQNDIALDTKLDAHVLTNNGAKAVGFLSKGSQDLVFICQRFCMLEDIYKKEKPFLILDDSFVNVDDEKINVIREIISLLTKDYQVIYFSCSKSRKI